MDEQMRRERARREKRRKKRRMKKRIFKIEIGMLVLIFAVLLTVVIRERVKEKESMVTMEANEESVDGNLNGTIQENDAAQKAEGEKETFDASEDDGDAQGKIPQNEEEPRPEEAKESETTQNDDNTIRLDSDDTGEIVLAFAGDICFYDEYSNMYSYVQKGSDIEKCISADLMAEMRGADVFMVNNEFTYTTRGEALPDKTYTFRSKPENVKILADMGVDIVSLANNHVYDYGEVSLLDTLDTLNNAGVPYVGAGRNLEEASRAVSFVKNGMKIAYLSATQIERLDNPDTKGATADSAGTFRCWGNKLEDLTKAVTKAKEENDFVVVYIHWGTENTDVLDWAQLDQAKAIAKAGADLIVGDHPHCLQQFANVEGVPVIYSLGNFWFNSKTLDTGLLKVTLNRDGIKSYQFLPAIQQNCATIMAGGAEKERMLEYMRQISPGVTIDGDGFVSF